MKKTISILVAFAAVLLCAASLVSCGKSDSSVPSGMKIASPDNVAYQLFVPTVWKSDPASGVSSAYYSNTDTSSVSVMTFPADDKDIDVTEWWNGYKEDFSTVYEDFKVEETAEAALGGLTGAKFVCTGKLKISEDLTESYKFMQIAAVRTKPEGDGEICVLTYMSSPDAYDSHLSDVEKIVGNFRFKSDFKEEDVSPAEELTLVSQDYASYRFYLPAGWACDVSAASVSAHNVSDRSGVSLMSFSLASSNSGTDGWWSEFIKDFESVYSDVVIESEEKTTLGGVEAAKKVYTGTLSHGDESETFKFIQVSAVKRRTLSSPEVFVFTYTATSENFDSHLDDVQTMIEKFEFK